MRLLLAGNDVTVIALWLGHEQLSTTNIYLHADMTHKQQAIDRTRPLATKPGRYRSPDTLLKFLEAGSAARLGDSLTYPCSRPAL
jgi:integrase/recombinase XerD